MVLSSSTSHSLSARFLSAKFEFIDATARGGDGLSGFYRKWAALLADFKTATTQAVITPEDIRSIQSVMSTINTFAAACIQAESEVDHILNEKLQDLRFPSPSDFEVVMSEWFLVNLYDPYPTKAQKEAIALRTSTSFQRVEAWMANARKLSGWTTLRQELYAGSRTAIVQAACHVFKDQRPDSVTSEAVYALLVVRSKAESMLVSAQEAILRRVGYSGYQFLDSPSMAANSTSTVADDEPKIRYPGGIWLPCASEHLDPETTSVGSFSDYEVEEDIVPPKPVAGVKRRIELEDSARAKRPRLQRMASVPVPRKDHRNSRQRRVSAPTVVLSPQPHEDSSASVAPPHGTAFSSQEFLNISPAISSPLSRKRPSEVDEEQVDCKRRRVSSHSPERESPDPFPHGLTELQSLDLLSSDVTTSSSTVMQGISDWQSSIFPEEHDDQLPDSFDSFSLSALSNFSVEYPTIYASQDSAGPGSFGPFAATDFFAQLMPLPCFDEPPTSNLVVQPLEPLSAGGLDLGTWDLFNVSRPWQELPTDFSDALSPSPSLQSESDSSLSEVSTPKSQHALLEESPVEHKVDFAQEIEHIIAHLAQ